MKRLKYLYLGTFLIFIILFISANILQKQREEMSFQGRNIVMNRINDLVNAEFETTKRKPEDILMEIYYSKKSDWLKEYKEYMLPVDITYFSAHKEKNNVNNITGVTVSQSVWALYDQDVLEGFLVFSFTDDYHNQSTLKMNMIILLSFILTIGIIIYIHHKILKPFWKLSVYPERLSKGAFSEKLPETKNRYFGKFIWGVNMLCDKILYDKKHIHQLNKERQTLLATIAHGIKTPISNIKLYADAIESGLYQEDGIPNEKDAGIAVKINKNADDVVVLVQEIIQKSMEGLVDFTPSVQSFYTTEIQEYIEEEYDNRLKMLKIPYEIQCCEKTLVSSDKNGIIRIISQLLENAVKYGDGTGIWVMIEKKEEGHYFTVKNNGVTISQNEIPYLFNSFWRGSNAGTVEGSGIGLYEAKQIAMRLSGDVLARETDDGMEFVVYVPGIS
ncbi:MAG: HAMP domain-containing histidine kinase [Oscillospiraceae bacterium]|nr:HAMP domain-containing histidine kinase [Oscillospiraceae bacterium]